MSELSDTDTPQSLLVGIGEMLCRENSLTECLTKALADDTVNGDELSELELLAERLVQAVFKLRAVVRKKHAEDVAHG